MFMNNLMETRACLTVVILFRNVKKKVNIDYVSLMIWGVCAVLVYIIMLMPGRTVCMGQRLSRCLLAAFHYPKIN
jgi:predicted membrane protein